LILIQMMTVSFRALRHMLYQFLGTSAGLLYM
jgi:hypothetical protein